MLVNLIALISVGILLGLFVVLWRHARSLLAASHGKAYALFGYAVLELAGSCKYAFDLLTHRQLLADNSPVIGLLNLLGIMFMNVIPLFPASLALLVIVLSLGQRNDSSTTSH